jgi:hypothetical protein
VVVAAGVKSILAVGASLLLLSLSAQAAPETYSTPEKAVAALKSALAKDDVDALLRIFGPEYADDIVGPDPVNTRVQRKRAYVQVREGLKLQRENADHVNLLIGKNAWPFPIPLVRGSNGWSFDSDAGIEEILARRIGENELSAIAALKAFVRAQNAYATKRHTYATYVQSNPGQTDGLWWDDATARGAGPSPLAKFVQGQREFLADRKVGDPFKGYYFRMLTGQGANVPGGAMSYVENGQMAKGFAMLAWPASYRHTGVMTFLVDRSGRVLQKDLGEDTSSLAETLRVYDPDQSWGLAEAR